LLKFVVVVLGVSQIWSVYELRNIRDEVRTVIIPPVINSKVEISSSGTTDSYVKEYVRYIGALLWNYSPATARNQFAEVLLSWHPSVYEEAKKRLYILANQIEQTRASAVFYIARIEHNLDGHFVTVSGQRNLMIKDRPENSPRTYRLDYKVENGRFWIIGMNEVDKDGKVVGAPAQQDNVVLPEVKNAD